MVKSIDEFLPFRNQAIQLFIAVAQYAPEEQFIQRLHRFFESLIPYMNRPQDISSWSEWDFDNFKFIVHKLFLYAIAILLKHDRLEQANYFLQQQYYVAGHSDYGRDVMVSFIVFGEYMRSLEHRKDRLKLHQHSLRADLLKERNISSGIDFRYLLQADFVIFMRAEVEALNERSYWWPETLLYLGHSNSTFEIFARSNSHAYFNRAKVLLAISSPNDLEPLLNGYRDDWQKLPRWGGRTFSPTSLLGFKDLATRP